MNSRRLLAAASLLTGAALILPGCSGSSPRSSGPAPENSPIVTPAAEPIGTELPRAEVLAEVIARLADPTVTGADKVRLVQDATPDDTVELERFAIALRDGGLTPVSVRATEIVPGGRPGEVLATIEVAPAEPGDGFSFPMGFRPTADGWQLTRDTAEMLLTAP